LVTDISGKTIGPIFNSKAMQEELDCLTFEDETDGLSQNFGNNQHKPCNITAMASSLLTFKA
jgi:hypothetical protein